MSRQKRRSRPNISIRLQPSKGSLLAKVAEWLKTMPIEEKNNMVSQLLVMTCLPLAQAETGADQSEVEKYYWEFEKWIHFYRFTVRERLNIEGQFHYRSEQNLELARPIPQIEDDDDDEEETEVASLRNQLIGEGKVENAGSIFSGFE